MKDADGLTLAAALAQRGIPASRPNPAVGALLARDGRIIARGWTMPGGRPHAEAVALALAGVESARGATLYTTLEPCAHISQRGPACADLIAASGITRLVYAVADPDPRTAGKGAARVAAAGIAVQRIANAAAEASLAGYCTRQRLGRPHVTLKLAISLDGCIAMADGSGRWITGEVARAYAHSLRAQSDAILIGRGTYVADAPRLDVRLPGLEDRSPARWMLTSSAPPDGWQTIASPAAIAAMDGVQSLLIEGGAQTASAFLAADLVDRLIILQAPILIGNGRRALDDIGLASLSAAHGRWHRADSRVLGSDVLTVYERQPTS